MIFVDRMTSLLANAGRSAAILAAVWAAGCAPSPSSCTCTLSTGVTLACDTSACIDGAGYACIDGTTSDAPSACSPGVDGGPPSDATASVEDGSAGSPCAFPLIRREGATATFTPPTAGRCAADTAIVCAAGPTPGQGTLRSIVCDASEECREYTVEAFVAPSVSSSAFEPLGSYVWARCVPRGAERVAYTFDAGDWTTAARPSCSGIDRLSPVNFNDLPDAVQPINTWSGPVEPPAWVAIGSADGYLTRTPCLADQRCVVRGATLACVGATALPCERARCEGTTLIGCESGFEVAPVDCASAGQECFVAPPDSVSCLPSPDHAASCQPPRAVPCPPASTADPCSAERDSYTYCDRTYCVVRTETCTPSEICFRSRCVPRTSYCEPETTASSCAGSTVNWCSITHLRSSADCGLLGMACTTIPDATQPGGTRSGCVATPGGPDPCLSSPPGRCDGLTVVSCCEGDVFQTSVFPPTTFACLPGRAVSYPCALECSVGPFGAVCDPP